MVVYEQGGCIRVKMVVFGKKWLYSGRNRCIPANWLYSDKVIVFGQQWLYSGKLVVIWAKVVVFGQKWLYSGNLVVFGQSSGIRAWWLYLGKSGMVLFGQIWLYSGKNGCIREKVVVLGQKWLYSDKVVVFGQSGCIRAK